ncbi:MAG: hypothetical protein O7G88_06380 [bacterium]|nr:hypothetical protein [bacterium]
MKCAICRRGTATDGFTTIVLERDQTTVCDFFSCGATEILVSPVLADMAETRRLIGCYGC